jgi:hypothetical protein
MTQFVIFPVDTIGMCCWASDLDRRNRDFLSSIDYRFFEYTARLHGQQLAGESRQQAAIALRVGYHHGLETLFTLLGAALQAPDCVVGYVPHLRANQLKNLVDRFSRRDHSLVRLKLDEYSWAGLSRGINRFPPASDPDRKLAERFGTLWARLAHDFLDESNQQEYNSIKHGFRVQAGGFALAIGIEPAFGVPAPPEAMRLIGKSEFGTSFFVPKGIPGGSRRESLNFQVRRVSLNWNAHGISAALLLMAMSINNVVSYLKLLNHVPKEDVHFIVPEDGGLFDEPWRDSPGTTMCDFDELLAESDIEVFSEEDIMARIKRGFEQNSGTDDESSTARNTCRGGDAIVRSNRKRPVDS